MPLARRTHHDEGVARAHLFGKHLASWSLSVALEGLLQSVSIPTAQAEHLQAGLVTRREFVQFGA
jgi:hypothetical protein